MNWSLVFLPDAQKDLKSLSGDQRILVAKAPEFLPWKASTSPEHPQGSTKSLPLAELCSAAGEVLSAAKRRGLEPAPDGNQLRKTAEGLTGFRDAHVSTHPVRGGTMKSVEKKDSAPADGSDTEAEGDIT